MSPFLAKAPGGDTLLDVHPTQLQVFRKDRITILWFYLEFWEDDGEIRLKDERAWFLPWRRARTESRASFSRWEKRSVIYNHFTELALEITK
ncbi:MAG: hypothetical protein V3R45_08150 [Candidatus Aminicenantaceae bacterium]